MAKKAQFGITLGFRNISYPSLDRKLNRNLTELLD